MNKKLLMAVGTITIFGVDMDITLPMNQQLRKFL